MKHGIYFQVILKIFYLFIFICDLEDLLLCKLFYTLGYKFLFTFIVLRGNKHKAIFHQNGYKMRGVENKGMHGRENMNSRRKSLVLQKKVWYFIVNEIVVLQFKVNIFLSIMQRI